MSYKPDTPVSKESPQQMEATIRALFPQDTPIDSLVSNAQRAFWFIRHLDSEGVITKDKNNNDIVTRDAIITKINKRINDGDAGPNSIAFRIALMSVQDNDVMPVDQVSDNIATTINKLYTGHKDSSGNPVITQQDVVNFYHAHLAAPQVAPPLQVAAVKPPPQPPVQQVQHSLPQGGSRASVPTQVAGEGRTHSLVEKIASVISPISSAQAETLVQHPAEAKPSVPPQQVAAPIAKIDPLQSLNDLNCCLVQNKVLAETQITDVLNLNELVKTRQDAPQIRAQFADLFRVAIKNFAVKDTPPTGTPTSVPSGMIAQADPGKSVG